MKFFGYELRAAPSPAVEASARWEREPTFDAPVAQRSAEPAVTQMFDTWGNNLPATLGQRSAAGVTVTRENPITHHTVFSCINVIAEGVAMLPCFLYRERGPQRRHATDNSLYNILYRSPAPHLTAFAFFKLVIFEKLHYGNHYSLIVRDPFTGEVVGLYPIETGRVVPFWYQDPETQAWRRAYRVSGQNGNTATFLEHEIFHVSNLPILRGPNYGLRGCSVWELYQMETIGGALAVEEFAHSSLGNGAQMSGFVSIKAELEDDARREIREELTTVYAGPRNAGKIGIFGSDASYQPVTQTNQEAQLIETRKFDRSVVAGILRVSSHLINDLEKATFSNIEHLDLGHYKHCLLPHLVDTQQTIEKDCLTERERRELYVEHDATVMLQGDQKTLGEVLEKAVQNGRMTPNEARAVTNLPPKDGGDELFINAASVPLRLAAKGLTVRLAAMLGGGKKGKKTDTNTEEAGDGA